MKSQSKSKSKAQEHPLTTQERRAADELARRVYPNKVHIKKLRKRTKGAVMKWNETRRAHTAETFHLLGEIHSFSLALKRAPGAEEAFRRKCASMGERVVKSTPTVSLCGRHFLQASRSLAYKYGLAIRGAILLGIDPVQLAERRNPKDGEARLTLKFLKEAWMAHQPSKEKVDEEVGVPTLKWAPSAIDSFMKLKSNARNLVILVNADEVSEVVAATAKLSKVKKHLAV